MNWRTANRDDLDLLAQWNAELIEDEGHRNPMTHAQLHTRMADWIADEYTATVFTSPTRDIAYALQREDEEKVYLRHFFVDREHRRQGHGREAMRILTKDIWPQDKRLVVEVLADNAAAYTFWSAMGYHPHSISLERIPGTAASREKLPTY
ncbi:MAG: GNAT family N-acetyltransferase [Verrucomicrobiia bacterium]|jgi:GNAT superfamily N-acetyltransferase